MLSAPAMLLICVLRVKPHAIPRQRLAERVPELGFIIVEISRRERVDVVICVGQHGLCIGQ